MFDEPSSFLDVQQRLAAAKLIRSLAEDPSKYVIVVEHGTLHLCSNLIPKT